MRMHHIGYAVRDIDRAKEAFEAVGYLAGEVFCDVSRNCNILFMQQPEMYVGGPLIELIAVSDITQPSPVDRFIKSKQQIYHTCYETADIYTKIMELSSQKWHLIDDVKPAHAIDRTATVAFMYNRYAGMIELLQVK